MFWEPWYILFLFWLLESQTCRSSVRSPEHLSCSFSNYQVMADLVSPILTHEHKIGGHLGQRIATCCILGVVMEVRGGTPKSPELSSEEQVHVVHTGFSCWVSVLGIRLCQCTSWRCCEKLCSALVNFFKTLSMRLPTSWWVIDDEWFTSAPAHISLRVFSSFWPKMA